MRQTESLRFMQFFKAMGIFNVGKPSARSVPCLAAWFRCVLAVCSRNPCTLDRPSATSCQPPSRLPIPICHRRHRRQKPSHGRIDSMTHPSQDHVVHPSLRGARHDSGRRGFVLDPDHTIEYRGLAARSGHPARAAESSVATLTSRPVSLRPTNHSESAKSRHLTRADP